MGESQWVQSSEEDRQRHLTELKLSANHQEAEASLTRQYINDRSEYNQLLGNEFEELELRLKERKLRYKKRIDEGLQIDLCLNGFCTRHSCQGLILPPVVVRSPLSAGEGWLNGLSAERLVIQIPQSPNTLNLQCLLESGTSVYCT